MAAPNPTQELVEARAILHTGALPATQRRLKVPAQTIEQLADDGVAQSLQVLGAIDPQHAGWALLMSGIRIARSADTLAPPKGREATSFSVGLLWAGLVAAVAGDRLIVGSADLPSDPGWEPGSDARGARQLAADLVDNVLDAGSSPEERARFAADSLSELDKELTGLQHSPAGWMLCTFGIWTGSGVGLVAAPLIQRGTMGLRRVTKPRKAVDGCAFAGALLAQTGMALLDSSGSQER